MRRNTVMALTAVLACTVMLVASALVQGAPDAAAAGRSRERARQLLEQFERMHTQYKRHADADAGVRAALGTFTVAKQAEAKAYEALAAAYEKGASEQVQSADTRVRQAAEASASSWQTLLQAAAEGSRKRARQLLEQLGGTQTAYKRHADADAAVKQALDAFAAAKQAEAKACEALAAAYENAVQEQIESADKRAFEAAQATQAAWQTVRNNVDATTHRRAAQGIRKQAQQFVSRYIKTADDALKGALARYSAAREAEAAVKDAIVAAYLQDNADQMPALQEQYRAADAASRRLTEAVYARNNAQLRRMPTEKWIADQRKLTPESALDELDAYLAVWAKSAEAWTNVAEVAEQADADTISIDQAKDLALTADYAKANAARRWQFARAEANLIKQAEQFDSEDLRQRIEEVKKVHAQTLATYQQQYDALIKTRKVDRERNLVLKGIMKAWNEAREMK